MIKLYGITQSRAFRPLWLLEELGLEYEQVGLDYRGKALEAADYRAINPNGRIPTLVDGDLVLWESMAIDLYLARKYGTEAGLWPRTVEGEALAWQWSFWVMTEIEHPLLTVLMHSRVLPEAKRDAARASRNRGVLQARLEVAIGGTLEREARSALLPAVRGTGSYRRVDEPPSANAPELGTSFTVGPRDVASFGVSMDFPIFGFGRHGYTPPERDVQRTRTHVTLSFAPRSRTCSIMALQTRW